MKEGPLSPQSLPPLLLQEVVFLRGKLSVPTNRWRNDDSEGSPGYWESYAFTLAVVTQVLVLLDFKCIYRVSVIMYFSSVYWRRLTLGHRGALHISPTVPWLHHTQGHWACERADGYEVDRQGPTLPSCFRWSKAAPNCHSTSLPTFLPQGNSTPSDTSTWVGFWIPPFKKSLS